MVGEFLDEFCIAVGGPFAQPVMYVGDAQPFDAQGVFVADEIVRKANRIYTARNRKQQAFETVTENVFC